MVTFYSQQKTDEKTDWDDDDFFNDDYDIFADTPKEVVREKCAIYEDTQTSFGYFIGERPTHIYRR